MRKYVFGPIRSRRLGTSLGVDLVPAKTCPLDCIYCEARATTALTMERKEYVDTQAVKAELRQTLSGIPRPDYITFSGAGEPSLHSGIGEIIRFLKEEYPECRVCLLTNGLLLGEEKLQDELRQLDVIIPSLDASNEDEYRQINRPLPGESLDKLVAGLISFRKKCPVRFFLEIFIVPGINDSAESISRFAGLIGRIAPDAIQLNTLDRPGAVPGLTAAGKETFDRFISALSGIAPVSAFYPAAEPHIPHNGGC